MTTLIWAFLFFESLLTACALVALTLRLRRLEEQVAVLENRVGEGGRVDAPGLSASPARSMWGSH